MTYGSTVSRIAERVYIQELARYLGDAGIISVVPKYEQMKDMWFEEAAAMLRKYYIHPSIQRPTYVKKKVRTPAELKAAFLKYINTKVFEQLENNEWIQQDQRTNIILVTEKGKDQMNRIADEINSMNPNDDKQHLEDD